MIRSILNRGTLGTAMTALLAASLATAPAPLLAAPGGYAAPVRPAGDLTLSVGTGEMVRLAAPISDLFVADDKIADVQVRSPNQIYVFGKGAGVTTVFATDKAGHTVYSANVHVGSNMADVASVIRAAMPDAQIQVQTFNGLVVLNGTVASPADVEQATSIVQGVVGKDVQVISRLKTATPLQVMLQVKVAEVSRTLVKSIGMNLLSGDTTGGFKFGIGQGRTFSTQYTPGGALGVATSGSTGTTAVTANSTGSSLFGTGNLFGVNILGALDLAENDGRAHTLAEPTLTALSGETASFLAGGEFPIVTTSGLNGTSVEYKQYGVSLAFTPTVLEGGRISMRVRPEVSELTDQGSVSLNGIKIPALTTRRTETTVELGSGQSFMIAGLLSNSSSNTTNKAPFLGSLPIIGALFKSNSFQRNESELVIVVTPYLVHPANANEIALPTDGYRTPGTLERVFTNTAEHRTGQPRPTPTVVPAQQAAPAVGSVGDPVAPAPMPIRKPEEQAAIKPQQPQQPTSAAPGFSF